MAAASKVRGNLLALLLTHALADAAIFLLHRASHRLTNEVAFRFIPGLSVSTVLNPWYLIVDPAIANFQTGYQAVTLVVFLLSFPFNVLFKTWAVVATILLCQRQADDASTGGSATGTDGPNPGILAAARGALRTLRSLRPDIARLWRPVFGVELLVAAAVVPLQFASLLVVTLPLTLPLILDLQAATPAVIFEGQRGWAAVVRSRALIKRIRWSLAVPFVITVVAQRLAQRGREWVLGRLPPRFYTELVEIPVVVFLAGTLLSLLLMRLQDVLPYVAYFESKASEELESDGMVEKPGPEQSQATA